MPHGNGVDIIPLKSALHYRMNKHLAHLKFTGSPEDSNVHEESEGKGGKTEKRKMCRKQAAVMSYVSPAPVFIHIITSRVKKGYETPLSYRGASSCL